LVEEFIVSFTHDVEMDYILPGIPPTGKRVEVPHVVVVNFERDKIASEHIYWDQASVLVQVGLLDPSGLPVVGPGQAEKLRRFGLSREEARANIQRAYGEIYLGMAMSRLAIPSTVCSFESLILHGRGALAHLGRALGLSGEIRGDFMIQNSNDPYFRKVEP
jgi:hypothetical protein